VTAMLSDDIRSYDQAFGGTSRSCLGGTQYQSGPWSHPPSPAMCRQLACTATSCKVSVTAGIRDPVSRCRCSPQFFHSPSASLRLRATKTNLRPFFLSRQRGNHIIIKIQYWFISQPKQFMSPLCSDLNKKNKKQKDYIIKDSAVY